MFKMDAFLKRLGKQISSRNEAAETTRKIDARRSSSVGEVSTPPTTNRRGSESKPKQIRRNSETPRRSSSEQADSRRPSQFGWDSHRSSRQFEGSQLLKERSSRRQSSIVSDEDSGAKTLGCCACLESLFKPGSEVHAGAPGRRDRRPTLIETATAMTTLSEEPWTDLPPAILNLEEGRKMLKWLEKNHSIPGQKWETLVIDSTKISYSKASKYETGVGVRGHRSCLFRCVVEGCPVVMELFKKGHFTTEKAIAVVKSDSRLVGIVFLEKSKLYLRFGLVTKPTGE